MSDSLPNIADTNEVLNYGAQAQADVAAFSEIALKNLKEGDPGEINKKLEQLIDHLKESSEGKSVRSMFRRPLQTLRIRCQKTCETVDRIALALQGQRDRLMKDIEMLEILYNMNREQYDTLSEHLERGRTALLRFREDVLIPLRTAAENNGTPAEIRNARDAEEQYDRFEKKLHDLELTRAISLQMAPQIRLLQNNNTVLAEKIQSSVTNTIPLWKSQMALTLGMEHAHAAVALQEKISDITNSLLIQNAQRLKETTVSVCKEAERGCVDPKTLGKVNAILIETLDEMLRLKEDGRRARAEAELELGKLDREIHLRLAGREDGRT